MGMSIEGYGINVDYDGQTMRIHPRNAVFATALAGKGHHGDVVLIRGEMADVKFRDANPVVNGELTIRTDSGQKFQLHFRRKQRDGFRVLAEQLGAI